MPTAVAANFAPGLRILCRDSEWLITRVEPSNDEGTEHALTCVGVDDLVRGHEAVFLTQLEDDIEIVDPRETRVVADTSSGFRQARLFLEAQLRMMSSTELHPDPVGFGAVTPMQYQLDAVRKALGQIRPRLLLADAVGLGKTIEIGMILAELIARGRADRILVLAKKATLEQFQSEIWNRFGIPLVRLDSAGIAKFRMRIPASKNPFEVFHRAIISVDTLKDAGRYRPFLERTRWDVVVIDEAHNVAGASVPERHLSYKLARLLSHTADSILLATATPHNGKRETFARLISLVDPSAIPDPKLRDYKPTDIAPFFLMRFKEDVRAEAGNNFAERSVVPLARTTADAKPEEEAVYAGLAALRTHSKQVATTDHLIQWGLYKRFLSSPEAFRMTLAKVTQTLERNGGSPSLPLLAELDKASTSLRLATSSRYELLKRELRELRWDGGRTSPRILVFTESTVTQDALAAALAADFRLTYSEKFEEQPKQALAIIHGGFPDTWMSKTVEAFGTGSSPVRMLIATDVASEGVNLHHECHHVIHYDLPWSIITLIQRNGRIDRFGQLRTPYLRYLLVQPATPGFRGDREIFERLVEKVEEINRSTRSGESVLRLYDSEAEEAFIAQKGIVAGQTDILNRADTTGANREAAEMEEILRAAQQVSAEDAAFLEHLASAMTGGAPQRTASAATAGHPAPIAASGRLRLFSDRDFLIQSYDFLRQSPLGQQQHYLPLEVTDEQITLTAPNDLKRRLGAPDLRGDFVLGANAIPEEAWPEHGRFRLTHKPERVQRAITAAFNTTGFWSAELLHAESHPIMRWLVERMAMQVPRGAAPRAVSNQLPPGEKCFCFIGQVSSQKGTPLITDAHAISFLPGGGMKHRPLRDALAAAGFDRLANTGTNITFNAEALRGLVAAAVKASIEHLRELVEQRRQQMRPLIEREEARLKAWYERRRALQLELGDEIAAHTERYRQQQRQLEEMDRYFEERRRNWRDTYYHAAHEPTTRLVLVLESSQ